MTVQDILNVHFYIKIQIWKFPFTFLWVCTYVFYSFTLNCKPGKNKLFSSQKPNSLSLFAHTQTHIRVYVCGRPEPSCLAQGHNDSDCWRKVLILIQFPLARFPAGVGIWNRDHSVIIPPSGNSPGAASPQSVRSCESICSTVLWLALILRTSKGRFWQTTH